MPPVIIIKVQESLMFLWKLIVAWRRTRRIWPLYRWRRIWGKHNISLFSFRPFVHCLLHSLSLLCCCSFSLILILSLTSQGYSKEKMPKGKSGPQPDLKIEKVRLLCTVWESRLVFEASIMFSGETTKQDLAI